MSEAPPATVTLRHAVPADFHEVRRITRDAYLRAGHFSADHPYTSVLEDVEHRAEHAQVWWRRPPERWWRP